MPELPPFRPVSLEEMDSVSLLNRIDSKYLTDERTLEGILADAQRCGYRALVADGEMISHYDTIYYDTPGHQMFLDHRNQRLVRQKVRTREYLASGRTFLEIKRKNNKGRTKKKRIGIPAGDLTGYQLPVTRGARDTVDVAVGRGLSMLLRPGQADKLRVELRLPESVQAPLAAGTEVGTARVLLDGALVAELPAVLAQEVRLPGLLEGFLRIRELWR